MSTYLSLSELAREAGITRQGVHRRVLAGKLPAVRIGNYYAVSRADADCWKQQRAERLARLANNR